MSGSQKIQIFRVKRENHSIFFEHDNAKNISETCHLPNIQSFVKDIFRKKSGNIKRLLLNVFGKFFDISAETICLLDFAFIG